MTADERQFQSFVEGVAMELDIDLRTDAHRKVVELWYTYGTTCTARGCNKLYYKDLDQAYQFVNAIYAGYMLGRKEWA